MNEFISKLLRPEIQEFIRSNEQADIRQLVLNQRDVYGVPVAWVAQQIQGRKKAKEKLPQWYATPGIVYPPALALEQCSSEITARYKQGLVSGHHSVDLTGGLGVDTLHFSRRFEMTEYVEPDDALLHLARHNLPLLGATNVNFHHHRGEDFLQFHSAVYDFLYLDPSRRIESRKVVKLKDCHPDVVNLQPTLLKQAQHVLIKASPLLDLKQASRELRSIDQFIVLSNAGECKELLISLRRENAGEPTIHAVDLDRDGDPTTFAFTWKQESDAMVEFSEPQTFLYEPNPALMKAGAFKLIGQHFSLAKLGPDTHLYTSNEKVDAFPGRVFRVIEEVALDKEVKTHFLSGFANILTRNYPLTVQEILRKTGLKEGGERYLICGKTRKHVVLVADRLR